MSHIEREIKKAQELVKKNYADPKESKTKEYAEAIIGSLMLVATGYLVIQIASLLN